MDPFTISALVAAGSSLVSGLLSNHAARSAQERSIEAQRSMQQMLLTGGAQMARNAKQAGLSPAFSLGQSSTPAASAPASNFAPFDFSSLGDIASKKELMNLQKEQKEVAKAETRKTSADAQIAEEKAEQEHIHTQDLKSKVGSFKEQSSFVDDEGNLVVQTPSEYRGEYGARLGQLEKERLDMESSGYKLQILQNDWNSKVYRGRDLRDDILQAVVEMPKLERDELMERINNFREDVNLKRTQEALNQCMSIYYMLAGSLSSAQTEGVQQDTKEKKAGSANETIENFSWKQLGKYIMVHGIDLVRAIGAFH